MAMRFINVLSLSDSLDSTRRLQQPRFLSRHLSQFIQTSITPETLSVGRKKTEPWNGIEYIRREQNTKQCWSVSSVYFGHIATYKAKEKQRMHGTLINCTHSPPSNFQFSSFVAFVFQCAPSIHISLSLSIFLSHLNSHGKLILGSIYFIFFLLFNYVLFAHFSSSIFARAQALGVCVCISSWFTPFRSWFHQTQCNETMNQKWGSTHITQPMDESFHTNRKENRNRRNAFKFDGNSFRFNRIRTVYVRWILLGIIAEQSQKSISWSHHMLCDGVNKTIVCVFNRQISDKYRLKLIDLSLSLSINEPKKQI